MKSNFNINKMTAIREIQFTGTLKDKWQDVKEFIFNDVLKDIDLSDIDKISVHEITSDVICNGRCFKPKKGSKRGYKLSVSINLKRVKRYAFENGNMLFQFQISGADEMFLMLLCHELFHYFSHSGKISLLETKMFNNTEANANQWAMKQLTKWREKK